MPTPGWYITQIETGRERLVCRLIEYECKGITVPEDPTPTQTTQPLLTECFSPTFKTRQKFKGEWRDVEKRLLPGYIVVVTPDPVALTQRLRAIPRFARLLSFMNEFVPLREDERAWIDENTKPYERTIEISIAYRKGDTLVITKGPLKGREGMITRIIRKKCVAVVEIHMGNKTITTEVGLAVMPEEQALEEGE